MNNLIRPMNIPVPPMLEQALGYAGGSRYVAFYWQPAGDELAWEDGQSSVVGANWKAWLTFVRHPSVATHLESYELGSSEDQARHWLLLDRQERTLYVGECEDVARFMAHHVPVPPVHEFGSNAMCLEDALNMGLDRLFDAMREISPPDRPRSGGAWRSKPNWTLI